MKIRHDMAVDGVVSFFASTMRQEGWEEGKLLPSHSIKTRLNLTTA